MDAVMLSRIKFAFTTGFHFIFVPLTIGMSWLLVWMLGRYWRTGEDVYRRMARFWLRMFGLSFAIGVATGIALEFQFGTNWSAFSRFVGDIFGAPLAAEVIFTFFLESTFIGLLLFGWGRLSRRGLWFASLMVAVGATMSAFWILAANSWMHTPAGYHIVNGRAELTDFFAAIFNESTIPRFLHTMDAALITGAMFVFGLSAWLCLHGRSPEVARRSLVAAMVMAFVAAAAQFPLGHYHALQVAHTQPEKLAAFEGLYETRTRAPALLFGVPNDEAERVDYAVGIPGGLSLLVYGDLDAEVKGLKDFPKDERPPVALTFYSFHVMAMLGGYFVALPALGLWLWRRKKLFDSRWFLKLAFWSIPLPFLANELGWIAAEVGRQPWIIYHVLRTAEAASPRDVVPGRQILIDLVATLVLYALLFTVWVYLIRRMLKAAPEGPGGREAGA